MTEPAGEERPSLIVPVGAAEAPILYFDECTNFGCNNGMVNATLVAAVYTPQADGKVGMEFVVQAHIRTTIAGATGLREALNKALLIAMPTQSAQH